MRVFENDNLEFAEYEVEVFESLPTKAKQVFFHSIRKLAIKKDINLCQVIKLWEDEFCSCNSPIEKIFMMAFNIVSILRKEELREGDFGVALFPQFEVKTEHKKYICDFIATIESMNMNVNVLIECDGHDFHQKTKKQVEYDNEREYEIKKQGYDILRFSGSQIYNNPFKCANDVFDYLLLKEERVG